MSNLKFYSKIDGLSINEFFKQIHNIDVASYSADDAGEAQPMIDRYKSNNETFLYAKDKDSDMIVGYINFFPVSDRLYQKIMDKNTHYEDIDDGISPEDIVQYKKDKIHHLFFLSIAIYPEYRDGDVIKILVKNFTKVFNRLRAEYDIEDISACVVSEDGKRFAERLGFSFHHSLTENEDKCVYNWRLKQ